MLEMLQSCFSIHMVQSAPMGLSTFNVIDVIQCFRYVLTCFEMFQYVS